MESKVESIPVEVGSLQELYAMYGGKRCSGCGHSIVFEHNTMRIFPCSGYDQYHHMCRLCQRCGKRIIKAPNGKVSYVDPKSKVHETMNCDQGRSMTKEELNAMFYTRDKEYNTTPFLQ